MIVLAMCHVVAVVVMCHVVVAVVPSVKSVLMSLLCAADVQSGLVVLVVVHVFFSSPVPLLRVSSSSLAFPSQRTMPSELVISHT